MRPSATLPCIGLLAALTGAACTHRQQAVEAPTATMHDTIVIVDIQQDTIVQYVKDSAAVGLLREQYAQSQYGYLRELVKTDSLVALLWDSIGKLILENQHLTEKAGILQAGLTDLQQRLLPTPQPAAYREVSANNEGEDKIASRRRYAQQLLERPRTIYTIGADDEAGEVEVTNSGTFENEVYVAVEVGVEDLKEVTAAINGAPALYRYQPIGNERIYVFVFALPKKLSRTVQLEFIVNRRNYIVKTSIKNLINK